MHYPWWYVPYLTGPMVIAVISVVHVLVAHYAVGGGAFLALETGYAYRTGNRDYLGYLKRHARFFVLLTVVFGAITGVGIWWTIGLASPLATEVLIRTFVFGWALEYVFFILELVAAFIFYYYWGRLAPRLHIQVAWIYAFAAWMSLVAITAITAFMLNPGDWPHNRGFWIGIFNPQFIPQVIARTGGALLLTSLYVYFHGSFLIKDPNLRDLIAHRSSRPALLGAIFVTLGGIGWYVFLPESAKAVLAAAAALNILVALIFALTVIVFFLLYFGPFRNPGWLTPGFASALFLFGVAAFTAGEFVREAVRKPYILYNVVLGSQILPEEVEPLRQTGYLDGGTWTKALVAERYPQVILAGRVDSGKLLQLPRQDQLALGEMIFYYHCNDCHAKKHGYSAAAPLVRGRPIEMIQPLIEHLEIAHFFMPPWSGTREEARLVAQYLADIAPPRPPGMFPELEGHATERQENP